MSNAALNKVIANRNDEFYTRYADIEKELQYYTESLTGKTIYCNCDDFTRSQFFNYFCKNFDRLKLKKLIATNYNNGISTGAYKAETTDGRKCSITQLQGDGSFNSEECRQILTEADIIVTNPPFSKFRPFMLMLEEFEKDFIVVGNLNAVSYVDLFPLIKRGYMRAGRTHITEFERVNGDNFHLGTGVWFTSLPNGAPPVELKLTAAYDPEINFKYDDCDAVEVARVKDIPCDYYGKIGVPITYFEKHNPEEFELIGIKERPHYGDRMLFKRFIIRRRTHEE